MTVTRHHEYHHSLDRQSPIPLYHQLKDVLKKEIETGKWHPGDQIPTEDELCQHYQVSKTTVRQALSILAAEGLIRREQGKGTYVAEPPITQESALLTGFSEEMISKGLKPSSIVLKLKKITTPSHRVAGALKLEESEPVIMIKRLRLADGEPMGIQTAYIPFGLCPELLREDLTGSLYQLLETKYNITLAYAQEIHYAGHINEEEARILKMPAGSSAFIVERRTFSKDGRPVEYVKSVMRGDRYKISLHLVRNKELVAHRLLNMEEGNSV